MGVQGGLLALLVGRVVIPTTVLADWGLAPSAAQAAAAEGGLRGCATPDPISGGALGWAATSRRVVAVWPQVVGLMFGFYATGGTVLLGVLGVLVCLPVATPLLVAGAVVGVSSAGGVAFLSSARSGSVAAAPARGGGGGASGRGHDSIPPGTPQLSRQQISGRAA